MITRVAIRGYKSLSDVDLDLSALTLVIGPNASGKSNLLDALGLLSRMVSGGTIRSAFDDHRGNPLEAFFVPPGGLEELLAKDVLTFSLGVEVELSDATVGAVERLIRDIEGGAAVEQPSKEQGFQARDREAPAIRLDHRVPHLYGYAQGEG